MANHRTGCPSSRVLNKPSRPCVPSRRCAVLSRRQQRHCCRVYPAPGEYNIFGDVLVLRVISGRKERFDGQSENEGLEFAARTTKADKERPLVRVRLSVNYRVHSRQMLCIGGSQIPFGWSFLSIAKVPMTWNQGDIWTCEVELPAGLRLEYKYVILEEQDWTKIENEDSEGVVEITYRNGKEPGRPPDVQTIQKQMAIVAWQPGPNRVLQVPTEAEMKQMRPGEMYERIPARPSQRAVMFDSEQRLSPKWPPSPRPFESTWEALTMSEEGEVILDRRDVWIWTPGSPGSNPRPNPSRSFNDS